MKSIVIGILAVVIVLGFWASCQAGQPDLGQSNGLGQSGGLPLQGDGDGTWTVLRWLDAEIGADAARKQAEAARMRAEALRIEREANATPTPVPTLTPAPTPTPVPAMVQTGRDMGAAITPLVLPLFGIAMLAVICVMMIVFNRRANAYETPAGKVFERGGAYVRSGNMIGPGVVIETPSARRYGWWWIRRTLHRVVRLEFDEEAPSSTTQVRPIDKDATAELYAMQARAAALADGMAGAAPKIPKGVTHLTLPQPAAAAALPTQATRAGADVWSVETARPSEQLELMMGLLHRLGLQAPQAKASYIVDAQRENP